MIILEQQHQAHAGTNVRQIGNATADEETFDFNPDQQNTGDDAPENEGESEEKGDDKLAASDDEGNNVQENGDEAGLKYMRNMLLIIHISGQA